MELSVGVLIVGSLYWENNNPRKGWRESRLVAEKGCSVSARIRYGRCSENRGNTYTMVFSSVCEPGRARVVRCKHAASSVEDLIGEAEHLWTAERSKELSNGRISAGWGCVALLVRPDSDIPEQVLDGWAIRVSHEPNYGNVPQAHGEEPLVDQYGRLHMPWPELTESRQPVPLDLLLVTATHPTLQGDPPLYPTVKLIADAWGQGINDEVSYFRNNRANSIFTFEDELILDQLKRNFPEKAKGIA